MPGLILEFDLTGCPVLLVGLGGVGRRRLEMLVESGARVRAVDPQRSDVPPGVELRAEPYHFTQLEGMRLVFAAAPPEVNRQVAADARARGLWVNSTSEPAQGNVTVPATWRDGLFQLAVSTSGATPSLASRARDHAAGTLGPAYGALAAILAAIRPEVLARIADPAVRARLFRGWSDAAWLHRVENDGPHAVSAALRAELERATHS